MHDAIAATGTQALVSAQPDRPRIVMCPPAHFTVSYSINPWMDPQAWAARRDSLTTQSGDGWERLHATLVSLGAEIVTVDPVPGLPDLVFTANAAVVLDGVALVARFRHAERQLETPHFRRFFDGLHASGDLVAVHDMPAGICLEGAGDCVHDGARGVFFLGTGFRSDPEAAPVLRDLFAAEVEVLELVDPRFYHMDTALCPLTRGEALVVRSAFTADGFGRLVDRFGADNLIEVPVEDAAKLAANAVCLGDDIVLAEASDRMVAMLAERGYRVHQVPIRSFGLSGGSAFCLTLRLDRRSRTPGGEAATAG